MTSVRALAASDGRQVMTSQPYSPRDNGKFEAKVRWRFSNVRSASYVLRVIGQPGIFAGLLTVVCGTHNLVLFVLVFDRLSTTSYSHLRCSCVLLVVFLDMPDAFVDHGFRRVGLTIADSMV